MAGDDLVALCATILRDRITPLVRSARRVALIGFPANQDCGAHADSLGALKLLSDLGLELTHLSDWSSFRPDILADRVGDGVILTSNALFGAGVPDSQVAQAIASLRNRTIMLPERVPADRSIAPAVAAALAAHPDLHIFVREPAAAKRITQVMAGKPRIELAPSPSFLLGPQQRKAEPDFDFVWVARTGRKDASVEAAARLSSQSAEKLDLPEFPDGIGIDIVAKCRPPTVMLTDWSSLVFRSQEARLACNALDVTGRAQAWLDRGLQLLSLGRVAITDRAGAHVLCLLLRVPHVFVDDGTGGNRSFFETWTRHADLCRFADTPARGWTQARSMLRAIRGE